MFPTAQPKWAFLDSLVHVHFQSTTKQNKGFPRKQEELCCLSDSSCCHSKSTGSSYEGRSGWGRGGVLLPLELCRAELAWRLRLSVAKGFLKDAAYRILTRVWSDNMEWEQQMTIHSLIQPSFIQDIFIVSSAWPRVDPLQKPFLPTEPGNPLVTR